MLDWLGPLLVDSISLPGLPCRAVIHHAPTLVIGIAVAVDNSRGTSHIGAQAEVLLDLPFVAALAFVDAGVRIALAPI